MKRYPEIEESVSNMMDEQLKAEHDPDCVLDMAAQPTADGQALTAASKCGAVGGRCACAGFCSFSAAEVSSAVDIGYAECYNTLDN